MALAEAYDKLAVDLVGAKERLARILSAKDKRATVRTCSMADFSLFFTTQPA